MSIKKVLSTKELMPLISDILKTAERVRFTVKGNSMYPLLRGSRDEVEVVKCDSIGKYDIVLYKRKDGSYVLHRVLKKDNDTLSIAGDFEQELEHPVYESQVIAKVDNIIRDGMKVISCKSSMYKLYCVVWSAVIKNRRKILRILRKLRKW
ncbi:MAG: peptidase S24 [Clostridia bacterium]|nr:peptidase S24 [Clostridia bacterium]